MIEVLMNRNAILNNPSCIRVTIDYYIMDTFSCFEVVHHVNEAGVLPAYR